MLQIVGQIISVMALIFIIYNLMKPECKYFSREEYERRKLEKMKQKD